MLRYRTPPGRTRFLAGLCYWAFALLFQRKPATLSIVCIQEDAISLGLFDPPGPECLKHIVGDDSGAVVRIHRLRKHFCNERDEFVLYALVHTISVLLRQNAQSRIPEQLRVLRAPYLRQYDQACRV